jgi:hypothetical protein
LLTLNKPFAACPALWGICALHSDQEFGCRYRSNRGPSVIGEQAFQIETPPFERN